MIKSVTVINYLGDSLVLELARPEKSGFAVESITGLGPGSCTINTTEVATNDGSLYNSARLSQRNIVMKLRYLWKNSIEESRLLSYRFFPLKHKVELIFETDTRLSYISGYVESNDPDIFSSAETTSISIICPNPYFYALNEDSSVVSFNGVTAEFEFPFESEPPDTMIDGRLSELIEFGSIANITQSNVYYDGDYETGAIFTINALGNITNPSIYNVTSRASMKIDTDLMKTYTGSSIVSGDEISINTVKGEKSITLLRNGTYTNILNCLGKDVDWLQLTKGDNQFAFTADSGSSNILFKIQFNTLFGGV